MKLIWKVNSITTNKPNMLRDLVVGANKTKILFKNYRKLKTQWKSNQGQCQLDKADKYANLDNT
jgi:hypothetical protein